MGRWILGVALAVMPVALGCSGNPRCVPGAQVDCGCGQTMGTQVCRSDGTFGACDCGGAGGGSSSTGGGSATGGGGGGASMGGGGGSSNGGGTGDAGFPGRFWSAPTRLLPDAGGLASAAIDDNGRAVLGLPGGLLAQHSKGGTWAFTQLAGSAADRAVRVALGGQGYGGVCVGDFTVATHYDLSPDGGVAHASSLPGGWCNVSATHDGAEVVSVQDADGGMQLFGRAAPTATLSSFGQLPLFNNNQFSCSGAWVSDALGHFFSCNYFDYFDATAGFAVAHVSRTGTVDYTTVNLTRPPVGQSLALAPLGDGTALLLYDAQMGTAGLVELYRVELDGGTTLLATPTSSPVPDVDPFTLGFDPSGHAAGLAGPAAIDYQASTQSLSINADAGPAIAGTLTAMDPTLSVLTGVFVVPGTPNELRATTYDPGGGSTASVLLDSRTAAIQPVVFVYNSTGAAVLIYAVQSTYPGPTLYAITLE